MRSSGTAQVVRRSLKQEFQAKATLRDVSHMKVIEYDAGKPKKVRKCPSMMTRLPELSFHVRAAQGLRKCISLCAFVMHLTNAISSHPHGAHILFCPPLQIPLMRIANVLFFVPLFTWGMCGFLFCPSCMLVRVNGVCDRHFSLSLKKA